MSAMPIMPHPSVQLAPTNPSFTGFPEAAAANGQLGGREEGGGGEEGGAPTTHSFTGFPEAAAAELGEMTDRKREGGGGHGAHTDPA